MECDAVDIKSSVNALRAALRGEHVHTCWDVCVLSIWGDEPQKGVIVWQREGVLAPTRVLSSGYEDVRRCGERSRRRREEDATKGREGNIGCPTGSAGGIH